MNNLSSLKEHFKSFVLTFIAMFALAVVQQWGSVEFTRDALLALGLAGVRAGVKGVLELLAVIKPTKSVPPSQK